MTDHIRELYQIREEELSLSVTQGEITEVTRKKIVRSGCRVYAGGRLGVAGALGEPGEDTWLRAEEAAARPGLPWPRGPGEYRPRRRDLSAPAWADGDFLQEMTGVLDTLKREYPQFIFSNKIRKVHSETRLEREGAGLRSADSAVELAIIVKHRQSLSPFDTALEWQGRTWDRGAFLDQSRSQLEAFLRPARLPEGPWVTVAAEPGLLLGKVAESLDGEDLGRGATLFSGKLGEGLFSPAFTLLADRRGEEDPCVPFFDAEGTALPEDCLPLIRAGVLERPLTDRRTAARFGWEATAAAGAMYDGAPRLMGCPVTAVPGAASLAELTGDGPAVWVVLAAGGDYTAAGDYATPVQTAYLLEGGRLVGRLPEFALAGNLYHIFGEGYRGITADRPLFGQRALVTRLKLS